MWSRSAGPNPARRCRATNWRRRAERLLKIRFGETTPDGAVTLEAVYCLGNCALSPAMMVDGRLMGRVDAKAFEKIAAELAA